MFALQLALVLSLVCTVRVSLRNEGRALRHNGDPFKNRAKRALADWWNLPAVMINCSFETQCKDLYNRGNGSYRWQRIQGLTDSVNTGPSVSEGYYMYTDASYGNRNDTAVLSSGDIMATNDSYCLSFNYSMYGADIGNLAVSYFINRNGRLSGLFSMKGDKGDRWHTFKGTLQVASSGLFRVEFKATRGNGYRGDIAVDDVRLIGGRCNGDLSSDTHVPFFRESIQEKFSRWSDWGACSKSCNGGQQNRSRSCLWPPCDGDLLKTKSCNTQQCEVLHAPFFGSIGIWDNWSGWTTCSKTCGRGERNRTRSCSKKTCLGSSSAREICSTQACKGLWGDWTIWSLCTKSCSGGDRSRTRACTTVLCEGSGRETEICNKQACQEMDDEFSGWSPWNACEKTNDGCFKHRLRKCNAPRGCSGPLHERIMCACKGRWGDWTGWSSCTKTCGKGERERSRNCPSTRCTGNRAEKEKCNIQSCEGQWGGWSRWSPCSQTCGGGERSRYRACSVTSCTGAGGETETCNGPTCEDALSPWSPWTSCSRTCEPGWQERRRQCSENSCNAKVEDSRPCFSICPDNFFNCSFETRCHYLELSPANGYRWYVAGSTSTAGTGLAGDHTYGDGRGKFLYAEASSGNANDEAVGRLAPPITAITAFYCVTFWYHMYGPDIGGLWVIYNMIDSVQNLTVLWRQGNQGRYWRKEEADLDIQIGKRFTIIFLAWKGPGEKGDIAIDDLRLEPGRCQQGTWGRWSEWACPVTCGLGVGNRTRRCSRTHCQGAQWQSGRCDKGACPEIWGSWSSWICSVSCGTGLENRNRTCQGNNCPGKAKEARICRLPPCLGVWSSWTLWGCDTSCGFGIRKRSRTCSPSSATCIGYSTEIDICESPTPCPDDTFF